MVYNFLGGKIHHTGKGALGGQAFKGPPPHAGCVKHRHFVAAFFQLGLERDHIVQDGFAKAGHADQRAVGARRLGCAGGA